MSEAIVYKELQQEWQDLLTSPSSKEAAGTSWAVINGLNSPARPIVLFAELEDVRLAWNELLEQFRLEEYADRLITRIWTVKDIIAHVAAWASEFRRQVEMAARGESFDYIIPFALSDVGPNQWNQVEVEKRRSQTLESIKKEFETETCRLQELVLELPVESLGVETLFPMAPTGDPSALWNGNISQIVTMRCIHDRWHMERMRQWQAASRVNEGA